MTSLQIISLILMFDFNFTIYYNRKAGRQMPLSYLALLLKLLNSHAQAEIYVIITLNDTN